MTSRPIRTDAPDTVRGVQRRIAASSGPVERRRADFDNLLLDTMAGIAEAGKEGHQPPDNPVEVARELLTYGGELYGDESTWTPWLKEDG